MYAAKTAGSAAAFSAQESLAGLQSMPLADRAAAAGHNGHRKPSRSAWLCYPFLHIDGCIVTYFL